MQTDIKRSKNFYVLVLNIKFIQYPLDVLDVWLKLLSAKHPKNSFKLQQTKRASFWTCC